VFLGRWTQDSLDAQLKPLFYEECPPEELGEWEADEQYQRFLNGSLCYLRALKPAEDRNRFVKTAGLTIAAIGIDQTEELPEDISKNLIGRISQPNFPQHLVFTPNPPNVDHWLAKMFPEDNSIPDHHYVRSSVYDNRHILGDAYIASLEAEYPAGHALHRRNILGRRGLALQGEPVYGAIFHRHIHAIRVPKFLDNQPLVESWDFGHKHPAVSWTQFPYWGSMHILLELMGDRIYLEEFIPEVLATRKRYFGSDPDLWVCCDPAGADQQSSGRRGTSIETLNEAGIFPTFLTGSNHPRLRVRALQRIASYMLRLTSKGAALCIDEARCPVICDAFEGGYVYPERPRRLMQAPNLRTPFKDGYYEHLMNTLEYAVLNFGADVETLDPGSPQSMLTQDVGVAGDRQLRVLTERARLAMRAHGHDPDDLDTEAIRARLRPVRPSGRAGY
jgi:hypothetical protein